MISEILLKQFQIVLITDLDQRQWENGNGALSVEATAYGLLTLVLESDLPYAKAVVNWLNANRGFGGVWKSTQVTALFINFNFIYQLRCAWHLRSCVD